MLFLVSLVMSGAAGHGWLTTLSEDAFSWVKAVSSNDGAFSLSTSTGGMSKEWWLCSELCRFLGDSKCKAEAADAILSAWWLGSSTSVGSPDGAAAKLRCKVSEAISGISWDMAVEAEEMTSGERSRVGEAWGTTKGSTSCSSSAREGFPGVTWIQKSNKSLQGNVETFQEPLVPYTKHPWKQPAVSFPHAIPVLPLCLADREGPQVL